jgi:hypothetical protein
MIEARKKAVEYFFVQKYGSPPEEQWHHEETVGDIIRDIGAPLGSRTAIVEILRNILLTRENHKTFEGKKKIKHPEDRFILKDDSEESVVLYDMLEKVPIGQAVVILNTWRRGQIPPLDPISYSAVNNFVVHSNKVKITARGTQKSGKKDMNSPWARARLGQCLQFKEQLRLGTLQNDHPDLQNAVGPPVYLHGLDFLDDGVFEEPSSPLGAFRVLRVGTCSQGKLIVRRNVKRRQSEWVRWLVLGCTGGLIRKY